VTVSDHAKPFRSRGITVAAATVVTMIAAITSSPAEGDASFLVSLPAAVHKCGAAKRITCVVDGDTPWLRGEKIRIADIDTPETSEPKCASELERGNRATDRLIDLLNAGPFELHAWPSRDIDRYGRKLRVLVRGGRSLGDILVLEGLARTWTGGREPWCGR
jgi:endonuclease YncB( thermonuclease family)